MFDCRCTFEISRAPKTSEAASDTTTDCISPLAERLRSCLLLINMQKHFADAMSLEQSQAWHAPSPPSTFNVF